MVAGAKFALLTLDGLVIHAHIDLHRRHILMSEQFLQAEWIAPVDQITDRESMPQNVRTHPLAGNSGTVLETSKELRHPIFGERKTRFREKNVIFSTTAPGGQFFFLWPIMIQIVEEIPLTVLPHRNAPLFRAFSPHRQDALSPVGTLQT